MIYGGFQGAFDWAGMMSREIRLIVAVLSNMHQFPGSTLYSHGPCPIKGASAPPPPLRSGQLDIKDAQCAENKDGRKFHITTYRIWVPRAFKRGILGAQNLNFFKVAKFAEKIGIDLTLISCRNYFFCAILSF